jgi:hypothetical protein
MQLKRAAAGARRHIERHHYLNAVARVNFFIR